MNVAFKEWAVVCDAILAGRQSVLIRKGGIAEGRAGFEFRHTEFELFPDLVSRATLPHDASARYRRPGSSHGYHPDPGRRPDRVDRPRDRPRCGASTRGRRTSRSARRRRHRALSLRRSRWRSRRLHPGASAWNPSGFSPSKSASGVADPGWSSRPARVFAAFQSSPTRSKLRAGQRSIAL